MVVWFYRADPLRDAQRAAEEHPSLTLKLEHPSLVLFRREYRNESEPSVLLFDRYDDAKKIAKDLASSGYGTIAIDTFGDEWKGDELRKMVGRSSYALKQASGMGSESYIVNGKFQDLFNQLEMEEEQVRQAEKASDDAIRHMVGILDIDRGLAKRLVAFGVQSGPAMSGMLTDDLTVGGAFTLHEAEEIIKKGTEKGFV